MQNKKRYKVSASLGGSVVYLYSDKRSEIDGFVDTYRIRGAKIVEYILKNGKYERY